jgi:hypothetical protein
MEYPILVSQHYGHVNKTFPQGLRPRRVRRNSQLTLPGTNNINCILEVYMRPSSNSDAPSYVAGLSPYAKLGLPQ